jgi:hypothetical protein
VGLALLSAARLGGPAGSAPRPPALQAGWANAARGPLPPPLHDPPGAEAYALRGPRFSPVESELLPAVAVAVAALPGRARLRHRGARAAAPNKDGGGGASGSGGRGLGGRGLGRRDWLGSRPRSSGGGPSRPRRPGVGRPGVPRQA